MRKIVYSPPTGDDVDNPSLSDLKSIVLNKEAAYWEDGSGDSGIEVEGADERLMFFNYQDRGIFIMLVPDYYVPVPGGLGQNNIETLVHDIGGNEFRFPSCCLLSKDDAWNIIEHFVDSGETLKEFDWVELYDIDFDHGF